MQRIATLMLMLAVAGCAAAPTRVVPTGPVARSTPLPAFDPVADLEGSSRKPDPSRIVAARGGSIMVYTAAERRILAAQRDDMMRGLDKPTDAVGTVPTR